MKLRDGEMTITKRKVNQSRVAMRSKQRASPRSGFKSMHGWARRRRISPLNGQDFAAFHTFLTPKRPLPLSKMLRPILRWTVSPLPI